MENNTRKEELLKQFSNSHMDFNDPVASISCANKVYKLLDEEIVIPRWGVWTHLESINFPCTYVVTAIDLEKNLYHLSDANIYFNDFSEDIDIRVCDKIAREPRVYTDEEIEQHKFECAMATGVWRDKYPKDMIDKHLKARDERFKKSDLRREENKIKKEIEKEELSLVCP